MYNHSLSEEFIRANRDSIDWYRVSRHCKLSLKFIYEFRDYVDWQMISRKQKLTEDFICYFQERVDWADIASYQTLSESFIEEFEDDMDWMNIFRFQTLSEEFIIEQKELILENACFRWNDFTRHKTKKSERFLRIFQSKLMPEDWDRICLNQRLSPEFISEFNTKINIDYVKKRNAIVISQFFANELHKQKLNIVKQIDLPSHCIASIASYL